MDQNSSPPTRSADSIAELIDLTPAHADVRVRFGLGEMQRAAKESGDAELLDAVRREGDVFIAFHTLDAYEAYLPTLRQMLREADLPYFRERAARTPNPRAKARYLHAVATLSKRYDDGQTAADAYLAALREYAKQDVGEDPDAFNALLDMLALAKVVCVRFGKSDEFKAVAFDFLLNGRKRFARVKARLLALIIDDSRSFSRDDLVKLREFSLALPVMLAGGDEKEITAVADLGRRLADRIGEPYRSWHEAEARALEARLTFAEHPISVQLTCARLMRLYHMIGDEDKLRDVQRKFHEAEGQIEYHTIIGQPDDWPEQVRYFQSEAQRLLRENGTPSVLLWLATNAELFPAVSQVRSSLSDLEEQGIGLFRKFAKQITSTDERILSETPPEDEISERDVHEHYETWWAFGCVLPFSIFISELVEAGHLTLEHVRSFLSQSWIGAEERDSTSDDDRPNDVVPLLLSGIRLYFDVVRDEAAGDKIVPALDSLVLRVEAVVRKMARLLDVPVVTATDRRGRPIMEYAGLELLDHPRIVSACGEDLIFFAKHTLLQQPEGLRDKVGHALMHMAQYREIDLAAVVLLVLRLAAAPVMKHAQESGAQPRPSDD